MNALVRIAPRRAEIHATRRALLRWGVPVALITTLAGATWTSSRYSSSAPSPPHAHHVRHPRRVHLRPSRRDRTFTTLSRAMYDSFPSWLAHHPHTWCPGSVRELLRASLPPSSTGEVSNLDAWHQPMELRCQLTSAGHTIQLRSPGADGMFDTPDDLYISR